MGTRVLIADDDKAIRRLLRRIVEEHPGWEVCGEAENGHEAISKAEALAPDVAVLDLAMPQMNGLEAAREIGKLAPLLPMLLLTVQEVSPELATEARKAGFQGAVSKSTGLEVVRGIETLLQERSFFQQSGSDLLAG
jgi:DNA-binding NarL/FixJ family response regulator